MKIISQNKKNNFRVKNIHTRTMSKFCSRLPREIEEGSKFPQLAVFTVDILPKYFLVFLSTSKYFLVFTLNLFFPIENLPSVRTRTGNAELSIKKMMLFAIS